MKPFDEVPLTIRAQVDRLKQQGLVVSDPILAGAFLSRVGYFRLSAYVGGAAAPKRDPVLARK